MDQDQQKYAADTKISYQCKKEPISMRCGEIKRFFIRLALIFLRKNLTYSFPAGKAKAVTFYLD
jgi:hypothetical protein